MGAPGAKFLRNAYGPQDAGAVGESEKEPPGEGLATDRKGIEKINGELAVFEDRSRRDVYESTELRGIQEKARAIGFAQDEHLGNLFGGQDFPVVLLGETAQVATSMQKRPAEGEKRTQ
jgi:hypothetical protein